MDVIVNTFIIPIYHQLTLPLVTVYDHPTDYPDVYVARLFGAEGGPTNLIMTSYSLQDLRARIKRSGFTARLSRDANDDEKILEVWI